MQAQRTLNLPGKSKPYVMAHRGNRALCPENTLASFRQAYADGADILETDLHLSADGHFMCIHDATVDRTTNGSGAVAEMSLAALKRLDAGGGECILTLQETTASLPADVALALELKTDRFLEPPVCRQLVDILEVAGVRERSVVLSFSLARIQAVQQVAPDLPIGWITASGYRPKRGVQLLGPLWPILVANPFYVAIAHRRRQVVCPLDTAPEPRLWFYRWLGCDAVLTDNPGKTVRALGR